MGRLVKHYGDFDKEDFVSAIMQECDEKLFTYNGQDYMIDQKFDKKRKRREFFFINALGMRTGVGIKQLSAHYPSLEELLNAPELDGKSFMDRYDELLTCDFVEYIAD
ncbi:hypothetical protein [Slackia piriformis]|uniref:hypothetical protein n=1 Tax=Slackia piriformis TaxID=626934 RepID=UPI0023F18518|nr:hypothetical protein [Slackia piriformis]